MNANAIAFLIHMRNPNEDVKSRTNKNELWRLEMGTDYEDGSTATAQPRRVLSYVASGVERICGSFYCAQIVYTRGEGNR